MSEPRVSVLIETPETYHLRQTWHIHRMGSYDPTMRLGDNEVAYATHTPEGPATLWMLRQPKGVVVRAYGDGASWLEPRFPKLLGLGDTPDAFQPESGPVKKLKRRFAGMHLNVLPRVFACVTGVVLRQVVTWQEAVGSWSRMVRAMGEDAPGPLELKLPLTARQIAATPDYGLMAFGIRPKQARTLRVVAKHAARIEAAAEESVEASRRVLSLLQGVGPWTVDYVVGSALGDADAVLLGDYNLAHSVAYALAGEPRASDERMLELLEPYRGHRFRVIRMIYLGGVHAPRRGPRL